MFVFIINITGINKVLKWHQQQLVLGKSKGKGKGKKVFIIVCICY